MDARWKRPCTCIVAGPKGCGKSSFVTRMLHHATAMIDPPPEKITWCYGEWQSAYATMDLVDVRFEEELPGATMFDSATRNLIIIEELMAEMDERVTTLFTKKSSQEHVGAVSRTEPVLEEQGESYHQCELSIQWCLRIPVTHHICRTLPSRCIRAA